VIDVPEKQDQQSVKAARSNRRAVPAHCTAALRQALPIWFRKLPIGVIELDPHVDISCVIQLGEDSARAVCEALREWLG
jgi:hypothetical protein